MRTLATINTYSDDPPGYALAMLLTDTGELCRAMTRKEYGAAYRAIRAARPLSPYERDPRDPRDGSLFLSSAKDILTGADYSSTAYRNRRARRYLREAIRARIGGYLDKREPMNPLEAYHYWKGRQ